MNTFDLTVGYLQSGLAAKVEKPSRKLRKERKNRAKKVSTSFFLQPDHRLRIVLFSCVARRRLRLLSPPRRASSRYVLHLYHCPPTSHFEWHVPLNLLLCLMPTV